MTREAAPQPQRDPESARRVLQIAEDYLEALQAGKAVSRSELLAAHPELASALLKRLTLLEMVHRATLGSSLGSGASKSDTRAGQRLRCPHCGHLMATSLADELFTGEDGGARPRRDEAEVTCSACGSSFKVAAALPSSAAREMPASVGKFDVLAVLGRGSFGTVYKARDRELDRLVAIKMPRAGCFFSSEEEERFLREARSAALLRHPGIVQVYEIALERGTPCIVSEYVDGRNLADLIAAARPEPKACAELVARIADALAYAHDRRVVHRDIKPGNIVLDTGGHPHLTDFGLARRDEDKVTVTVEGQILGTPAYMPPEQAAGDHDRVDARSDVYSLGVVLYELLTGERPFQGSRSRLIHQVLHDEPRAPRSLNEHIPRDLETICLKAMAKEPGRRYASAMEMALDLRRFLAGEPILARPAGAVERCWRWARRKPVVAGLLAAVVTLVALSGVGAIVALVRLDDDARKLAREGEHVKKALQVSNERLMRLSVETGVRAMDSGDYLDALSQFIEALRLEEGPAERKQMHRRRIAAVLAFCPRLLELWFLGEKTVTMLVDERAKRALAIGPGKLRVWDLESGNPVSEARLLTEARCGAIRPGADIVAIGCADGSIRSFDASTGQVVEPVVSHGSPVRQLCFGPRGDVFASVGDDGSIKVWPTNENVEEPAGSLLIEQNRDSFAMFDPGGGVLVTFGYSDPLRVWDAHSGELRGTPLRGPVFAAAFSPDGSRIVTCSTDWAQVWDVATHEPVGKRLPHSAYVNVAAFSPDGETVATACHDWRVRLWSARTGEPVSTPLLHQGWLKQLDFSPDGRTLLTAGYDGLVRLWETSKEPRLLQSLHHQDRVHWAKVLPDGVRVVTATIDGTIRLWETGRARDLPLVRTNLLTPPSKQRGSVERGDFSGDGALVAFGGSTGHVTVVRTDTLKEAYAPLRHPPRPATVRFSPDSRVLLTASPDRAMRLWSAATGEPAGALMVVESECWDAHFDSTSRRFVIRSADATAQVWDASSGQPVTPPLRHSNMINMAIFSPDDRWVLTTSRDNTAKVWDAETGELLHTLAHPAWVNEASFSPDGALIAVPCEDRQAWIWSTRSWQVVRTVKHDSLLGCAYFSPGGDSFVTASYDRTARLWSTATGEPISPPLRHEGVPSRAEFSRDGSLVVTPCMDGTARVWDARTGEPVTPPLRHGEAVMYAHFSPDGKRLLTLGPEPLAKLWDLPIEDREVEDLVLFTQLLSSRRSNSRTGQVLLSAEELEEGWNSFQPRAGGEDRVSEAESEAWHFWQAAAAEQRGDGTAFLWHLDRLLEKPGRLARDAFIWRGSHHARQKAWGAAAADFAAALEAGPVYEEDAYERACLLFLKVGDLARFRAACRLALQRLSGATSEWADNIVAYTYALGPQSPADVAPAVDLARRAYSRMNNAAIRNTLGAVLFRAGKLDAALEVLLENTRVPGKEPFPQDCLFLAMTFHALGRLEEARSWEERAEEVISKLHPSLTGAPGEGSKEREWEEELELTLLRDEARAGLGEKP